MISECKAIASDFKKKVIQQRTGLGPVINVDDIDEYEIGENDLVSLFERFKNVMGLRTTLGFFRDTDGEYGRYSEQNDAIYLPLCIGMYGEDAIIEHMTHELYHAFQYYAISSPSNYPCFHENIINTWSYEFSHYVSGDKDMQQYFGQEIEKTAREFGRMMMMA